MTQTIGNLFTTAGSKYEPHQT